MILNSAAFQSGGMIPDKYTCDGDNISPPLAWDSVPEGTEAVVLIVDDPDAPAGPFTHWVLYNLNPEYRALGEGISPGEEIGEVALEGRNDFGNIRYEGPCPPAGDAHTYFFRLFAVDQPLELSAGATRAQVLDAIQGHVLEATELQGLYGRPLPRDSART